MSGFTVKLTGRPEGLKALLSGFPTANVILTLLFYVITLGRFCPIIGFGNMLAFLDNLNFPRYNSCEI